MRSGVGFTFPVRKSKNLVPRPDAPVLSGNRNHPSLPSEPLHLNFLVAALFSHLSQ